jgi:5'-nucleotidase
MGRADLIGRRARWAPAAPVLVAPVLVAVLLIAQLFIALPAQAQQEESTSPRLRTPLTLLQINDVYSTVPVDGLGGLARVATIRKTLAASGRTPLLMLAGDFLSSSVASSIFRGEQMIAGLNAMGLDFATLGNHEFDFGVDMLITRMQQAKWQWVIANVIDRRTNGILGGAPAYVIRTVNGVRVGILGLCLLDEGMNNPELRSRLQLLDPIETAATLVPQMKAEGADVIVALTHLRIFTDQALARRVPDIDVIVGGHEHYPIIDATGRTLITKAGMDARAVARIDLDKRGDAPLDRFYELIPVTSAVAEDPAALTVINDWESRLGAELDAPLATSTVALDALESSLRTRETNIGDLFADAMRQQAGADVALINSGGIRSNRVYPPGPLSRRNLLELHPFGNITCKIEVTGRVLLQALEHSVLRLPLAAGTFPQVSGLTMRVNVAAPAGQRVSSVTISGAPLDPAKTYTLALPDFVMVGGDGFTMFGGSKVLIDAMSGMPMIDALQELVASRRTISPATDGRITIVR